MPLLVLFVAILSAGCGEKDLIDDDMSSEDQVRSLVEQFQDAVEQDDDEAACRLLSEDLRTEVTVFAGGAPQKLPCGMVAAGRSEEEQRSSLPEATILHLAIDRHDEGGEVQLDDGTRLLLRRAGGDADGEWRISGVGYRRDGLWERDRNPLSASDPREAARSVRACLEAAGFKAMVLIPEPDDEDAPDAAVGFRRGTGLANGGEVAIYESGVEAVDKLEAVAANVEGFDGVLAPRGRAGVIFFGRPESATRDAVLACVR